MLQQLSMLDSDPIGFMIELMYMIPAMLIALTLHEVAHGYIAHRCGDDTALMLGRLSLNPLKHIDPVGTVCLLLFRIGWAKPVPVNPRKYKNFRRDDFLVSIAGIVTNLILFLLGMILSVACIRLMIPADMIGARYVFSDYRYGIMNYELLSYVILTNRETIYLYDLLGQGVLNNPYLQYVYQFLYRFTLLNLSLALFNFLPFPPLDGYHIFNDILFRGKLHLSAKTFRTFMMILIIVILLSRFIPVLGNAISGFFSTIIDWIYSAVLSVLLPVFGLG